MYQGRPYGLHVIGGKLTSSDQAFISVTANRFSNLIDVSKLSSMRLVYDLPDGGYMVVQDMGGNFRVIAHKVSRDAMVELTGMATDYIPMLYSGAVLNAMPYTSDGVPIRLTEPTRRRLINYDRDTPKPEKVITLKRFMIEYDPKFMYFKPANTGIRTFTQYHKLRATWYSGAMSEVVQVIGGYGKQDTSELAEDSFERVQYQLPSDVLDKIRERLAGMRLPACDGIPDSEGQYKYDYRYNTCNGVSFDEDGKPWLLRINPAGVYAMPLPLVPATTFPEFLDYLYTVDDHELIHVVERFGGMPTGENFPTGNAFQSWYRAGVIIKVCDTGDFYKHFPFYEACGWSFNSQGTEAFNTGWSGGGTDMRYAYGFKARIRLGAVKNNGLVSDLRDLDTEDSKELAAYLNRLNIALDGNDHRERAIRYKIANTPTDELMAIAKKRQIDVDYWDNLIADPIANHLGQISQTSKGNLYWGSPNPLSFGLLKFPEFTGQGCASFDMSMPEYEGKPVRCDTVVFGCYVDDQLTVIKYFLDKRTYQKQVESTFEEVMIVGQWEKTETNSSSGLQGYLYTTDFDDRRDASDSVTYTKITGEDLGYGNPAFATPPILYVWGSLTRSRYYSFKTETTTLNGDGLSVAVCVPTFARDSILYAFTESSTSTGYSDKMERGSVGDPTTYTIWTYDPIFHWMGGGGVGEPSPTVGDYVYVNYGGYEPNKYSWFADSGNWYGVTEGSYKDVSGMLAKYTQRGGTHAADGVVVGGEAPRLDTYNISSSESAKVSGKVGISMTLASGRLVNRDVPSAFYYDFSPVDSGGTPLYFYRDATWITSGTQRYSSTSELKANGLRSYWGSTKLADHKSAHCFIGVINE